MKSVLIIVSLLLLALLGAFSLLPPRSNASDDTTLDRIEQALKDGRSEEALQTASDEALFGVTDAELQALYGIALLSTGDLPRAQETFLLAFTIEPDNPTLAYGLARMLEGRRKTAEAITYYQKAARGGRFKTLSAVALSRLLFENGSTKAAHAALSDMLGELGTLSARDQKNARALETYYRFIGNRALYRLPEDFQKTTVDLESTKAGYMLDVVLGEGIHARFLLATGFADDVVINRNTAEALKLEWSSAFALDSLYGDFEGAGSLIENLSLGSLTLENVPVRILDGDLPFGNDIDGVIGTGFFKTFPATIDFDNGYLVVYNPARAYLLESTLASSTARGGAGLFFAGMPLVEAVDNQETNRVFAIDTGRQSTEFNISWLEKTGQSVTIEETANAGGEFSPELAPSQ